MNHRSFLPEPRVRGAEPTIPPMAQRLQQALAKVITDAELEQLLQAMLVEAKSGSAMEKRGARQLLLGLLGARRAVAPQYVQQNYYSAGAVKKKSRDMQALVVRYLEHEGPAGPETIAAEIARPVRDVCATLQAHPELFERAACNHGAWSLRRTG